MNPDLDSNEISKLYHDLGHVVVGSSIPPGFEAHFRQAEADYNLERIQVLLDLLADDSLKHEDERKVWMTYYSARKALLQWKPKLVLELVSELMPRRESAPESVRKIWFRLDLLRGQSHVMLGDWNDGIQSLKNIMIEPVSLSEADAMVKIDANEWIARAYIGLAESSGGWIKPKKKDTTLFLQSFLTWLLFPFFRLYLNWKHVNELRPALHYLSSYLNWPVFLYYSEAFKAVKTAKRLNPRQDVIDDTTFSLNLIEARLYHAIGDLAAAKKKYEDWKENPEHNYISRSYALALVKQGLAQVLLDLNAEQHNQAEKYLVEARQTYIDFDDRRAAAHVDVLLGALALRRGLGDEALARWKNAFTVFNEFQDIGASMELLSRCYAVLDNPKAENLKPSILSLIDIVPNKLFAIRQTTGLFNRIQLVAWQAPLVFSLILMFYTASTSLTTTLNQQQTVGLKSMLIGIVASTILIGIIGPALATFGLLRTLGRPVIEREYLEINEEGITRLDFAGNIQQALPWSSVARYLQIERSLWAAPSATLSFNALVPHNKRHDQDIRTAPSTTLSFNAVKTPDNSLIIPGTVVGFRHLHLEIEKHLKGIESVVSKRHGLRLFGGLLVVAVGLSFVATAVLTSPYVFPDMPIELRAGIVAGLNILNQVSFMLITGYCVFHYAHAALKVSPSKQTVRVVSGLGLLLIILGFVTGYLYFVLKPYVIFWGAILLCATAWNWLHSASGRERWIAQGSFGGLVLISLVVMARYVVLFAMLSQNSTYLVRLLNTTYVFRGAAYLTLLKHPIEPLRNIVYFQKIQESSEQMITLDPSFWRAHTYLALADLYFKDYSDSITEYNTGIGLSAHIDREDDYCLARDYEELLEIDMRNDAITKFDDEMNMRNDAITDFWKLIFCYKEPDEMRECDTLFPASPSLI